METTELWTRYASGDADARQRLLNEHLGLVYFVARQIAKGLSADVDFDEFVSAGTLGLMSALESFDPGRGLAFSTFAAPRIRGAVLDELRRQDYVPRSIRKKTRQINAAAAALQTKLAHEPSDQEIAKELNVDIDTLWRWRADVEGAIHVSLDRNPHSDDESAPSPAELLSSTDGEEIEDRITHAQEVSILREAIQGLDEQERTVVTLYYFEELKLHEIATILELTESRVSQIRSKALARLRLKLACARAWVA
jgi:RNA polymerase sigma factor FliA